MNEDEKKKPQRNGNLFLVLRGKSGNTWFTI